jgi:hypothetical protein
MAAQSDPLADSLAEFRNLVSRRAKHSAAQWEKSRHLIQDDLVPSTLERLRVRSLESALPGPVRDRLCLAFSQPAQRIHDLDGDALKQLTGLPATKAVRALCVYFELVEHPAARWPVPAMPSHSVEQILRETPNPFDLLLHSDVASVLDLGAGDLSFADELTDRYLPLLRRQNRTFILHCVDRLHPHSKLGGPLHPDAARLRSLRERLGSSFGFFGNQNMFELTALDEQGKLAPRYAIATCWAPATPTFAYEPSRLSPATIDEHLRRTKGLFRHTKVDGEPALEVRHGERLLLFPPWKFDIVGPLALLRLLARRGSLCLLGAVDAQVFWEILAQLLEDLRYRPPDIPFTPDNIPDIFGEVYRGLDQLPIGASIDLAALGTIRQETGAPCFRRIHVRRGPTFPEAPASSTARKFSSMAEETTPWCLTLVPA